MVSILGVNIPNQVIYLILIIIGSYFVYKILKIIIYRLLNIAIKKNKWSTRKNKTLHSLLSNILKYFIFIVALFAILGVFGVNAAALITSLGVLGLVAGLALQDFLKDILAGLFILVENQYAIGDVVEISSFKGEVVDLGLRTTKVQRETGEIKIISNRNIMEVINYSLKNDIKK